MKVSTRLAGGFGLLVLILVGIVSFNVSALVDLVDSERRLARLTASLHLGASEFQVRLQQMDEYARKYAATGDSAYARRFGDYVDAFDATLVELKEQAPDAAPEVQAELSRMEGLWDDFSPVAEEFSQRPSADPVSVAEAAGPVVRWVETLRAQAIRTSEALRRSMQASVAAGARRAERTERFSWIAAGLSVLLALVVGAGLVQSIGGGLGRLAEGTRRVASGDLDHRLETTGPPEFSLVAGSFNEMTRRLQDADRMKRSFFAHVSHDLKSPVSAMLDAHDLLLDEVPGDLSDDQERLIQLSRESGVRLREMIDQLLELARLDSGAGELDPEDVDVASTVGRVLREQEPRLRKSGVELNSELPREGLRARVDESYLTRLVENLVTNAVDHSPEGGTVRVALRSRSDFPSNGGPSPAGPARVDGGWLELEVMDQGSGIPPGRRESVFRPFVRGEEPGEGTGGLGLGLALCRQVAEAHGGTVWVEDGEDGSGSRFRLLIPLRGPGAEA